MAGSRSPKRRSRSRSPKTQRKTIEGRSDRKYGKDGKSVVSRAMSNHSRVAPQTLKLHLWNLAVARHRAGMAGGSRSPSKGRKSASPKPRTQAETRKRMSYVHDHHAAIKKEYNRLEKLNAGLLHKAKMNPAYSAKMNALKTKAFDV